MQAAEQATRRWVEEFVVAQELCPFARREVEAQRLRYRVSEACEPAGLLQDLADELQRLLDDPGIETTLLVHPGALQDFGDYNDFLDHVDALLQHLDLEGVIQVASFHPQYRFADTDAEDPANYTNRSPYPMLHLIREDSLARAIAAYPDVEAVPGRNIQRMRQTGIAALRRLLQGMHG